MRCVDGWMKVGQFTFTMCNHYPGREWVWRLGVIDAFLERSFPGTDWAIQCTASLLCSHQCAFLCRPVGASTHTVQCNPDIIEMLKRTLRCIRAEPIWIVHTALVNLLQILCLNICNKMHCCINLPYLSWSKSWNELFQYHARQFCAKVKCSFGMKVLLRRSRINFRI